MYEKIVLKNIKYKEGAIQITYKWLTPTSNTTDIVEVSPPHYQTMKQLLDSFLMLTETSSKKFLRCDSYERAIMYASTFSTPAKTHFSRLIPFKIRCSTEH